MNKRNIYIYVLLAATTLGITSCDKFLDKLPDNRMELNNKEIPRFGLPRPQPCLSGRTVFGQCRRVRRNGLGKRRPILRPSLLVERHHRDTRV